MQGIGRPFKKLLCYRKEVMVAWRSAGAGEKWSDPGCTLKIEPAESVEIFIVGGKGCNPRFGA